MTMSTSDRSLRELILLSVMSLAVITGVVMALVGLVSPTDPPP